MRIDGTKLKLAALILMCIDHVGAVLTPAFGLVQIGIYSCSILRVIGRLSFPIYAFLLAEGAIHTRNWKRYALRLGSLFLLCEPIYDLLFHDSLFYPGNQNIFLTLLLGLLVIEADIAANRLLPNAAGGMLGLIGAVAGAALGGLLQTDYGAGGILMIYICYYFRESRWKQLLGIILVNLFLFGGIQAFAGLAVLLLMWYDGTPGTKSRWVRDGFYLFYPAHLLILLLIKSML